MSDIDEMKEIWLLSMEREVILNKLSERKSNELTETRLGGLEKLGKQQSNVILMIGTMGEMIPSYLGLCMDTDRSSLSRMIDSMEKKGIVNRRTNIEDRRKIMISLTEKGEEYYEILKRKMEEALASIICLLDEQDIKEYKACIKKEISILEKIDSKLDTKE